MAWLGTSSFANNPLNTSLLNVFSKFNCGTTLIRFHFNLKGDSYVTSELHDVNNIRYCRPCIPVLHFLLTQWHVNFVAMLLVSKCLENFIYAFYSCPREGRRGLTFKSRIRPPYPQRVIKQNRSTEGWSKLKRSVDMTRSGIIESITTLWRGHGNPIRVSMICNPRRGLPSRGCCKSWTRGWDSLVPYTVWWLIIFLPCILFSINNPISKSF